LFILASRASLARTEAVQRRAVSVIKQLCKQGDNNVKLPEYIINDRTVNGADMLG